MKIGLFTALFSDKSLDEVLDIAQKLSLGAVEIGAGAYPGSPHLDVEDLLANKSSRDKLQESLKSRGIELSAISVHGNPLHPNREIADHHHHAFRQAVELAHALGINRVNGFSGCPGDNPDAKYPNWVTCAWPDEFREISEWQWNERLLPYWSDQVGHLAQNGVRFCLEMHPGFTVYNNESLFRLRNNVGENGKLIGANFDPSHLWWQGIDPLRSARELGLANALFHVHAKDTRIDPVTSGLNGNLDVKSYHDVANRGWVFRSVGYGHGVDWWREFVSVLRTVGYDDVLSIEHEDALMSSMEGLTKAVDTLRQAIIAEPAGAVFWAKE